MRLQSNVCSYAFVSIRCLHGYLVDGEGKRFGRHVLKMHIQMYLSYVLFLTNGCAAELAVILYFLCCLSHRVYLDTQLSLAEALTFFCHSERDQVDDFSRN